MKFLRILVVFAIILTTLFSCKKEPKELWNVTIEKPAKKVQVIDISKEYFDKNVALEAFKAKYPWFQGSNSDTEFVERRSDSIDQKIYKDAISKIDINKLNSELSDLFSHVKYYFPQFKEPSVFLYSSAIQNIQNSVILADQDHLFIDISAYMGEKNPMYKGIDLYRLKTMNPQNIVPQVSDLLAEQFVPINGDHQKFIDVMVYNGKLLMLQDAFLPKTPDYLKIDYTPQQLEWAQINEENTWNFFVENNLVFSDDTRLGERFIAPLPFSKFYTEIDNESSPRIGTYIGWMICRAYFEKKPETKLVDFLKMDATTLFNTAQYKPKVE